MRPNEKQKIEIEKLHRDLYLHSIKQLQWTTQTFVGQH